LDPRLFLALRSVSVMADSFSVPRQVLQRHLAHQIELAQLGVRVRMKCGFLSRVLFAMIGAPQVASVGASCQNHPVQTSGGNSRSSFHAPPLVARASDRRYGSASYLLPPDQRSAELATEDNSVKALPCEQRLTFASHTRVPRPTASPARGTGRECFAFANSSTEMRC
jgi:hypothetical protein